MNLKNSASAAGQASYIGIELNAPRSTTGEAPKGGEMIKGTNSQNWEGSPIETLSSEQQSTDLRDLGLRANDNISSWKHLHEGGAADSLPVGGPTVSFREQEPGRTLSLEAWICMSVLSRLFSPHNASFVKRNHLLPFS